ncbi:MAG: DMT family transporter [Acidobacteriota bacterium]
MKLRAILALSGTIILFSTFEVVSKMMAAHVNPLQINFLRFIIGGLILLPLAVIDLRRRQYHLDSKDLRDLFFLGFLNVTICLMAFQICIRYIPASLAAVIFCTNPVFVHLTESVVFGSRFNKQQIAGIAASLIGLLVVSSTELHSGGSWIGVSLAVFSAVTYGIFIVFAKGITHRVGSFTANALPFILGSLALIPVLLYKSVPFLAFNYQYLPHLLYLAIGVTSLAYYLFLYGLQHLPAGSGSLIFFVKPVLATLLAVIILNEPVTLTFIIGSLIIISGLLIYSRKPSAESV